MDRLVYSLDRTGATPGPRRSAREIRTALERFKIEHEARALDFRFAGRRLFLTLPPDPAKGARAQDIVHEVLGIEEPSFLIRRDAVSLKN